MGNLNKSINLIRGFDDTNIEKQKISLFSKENPLICIYRRSHMGERDFDEDLGR